MIRCKIRKHTKAVAVLILCVAVCIILIAAFGGERKIPFFGTWRIEREVIIPELTPELTSGMPLEEAMFVTTDFIGYELEYTGESVTLACTADINDVACSKCVSLYDISNIKS